MDQAIVSPVSACWTCLKRKRNCDGALPHCRACTSSNTTCAGYGVRPRWPFDLQRKKKSRQQASSYDVSKINLSVNGPAFHQYLRGRLTRTTTELSSVALPAEESFFMQHFIHNVSRLGLAIDYNENGYRMLLPMAVDEPALLYGMLAVSASHYGRWKLVSDTTSRKYLRTSMEHLCARISRPDQVNSPITLATMMLLLTFEVFAGSTRWKNHYDAIQGWIKARGDCSDLDPFLKAWVCMIGTQCTLNLGCSPLPQLDRWMDDAHDQTKAHAIDPLIGCSEKLPRLMSAAAALYQSSRNNQLSVQQIKEQVDLLQDQIRETKIALDSNPNIRVLCHYGDHDYASIADLNKEELRIRMVAAAEIFRHASHIYVFRICNGPEQPLSADMAASLRAALDLFPQVPDAVGPGSCLGWCLVVIGAELDSGDDRDYIRSRWDGLHLTGIHNSKNAQRILEAVWTQRDLYAQGLAILQRWQDIMEFLGEFQILL